ncbi:MAG: Alkaline phosphatase (EC [uncultured Sulfurovum sp.]|uniref:Alkaline phosphatase (EC) n=1 Tax=uncultured Sulfurovum sp. TaxID=269237 RepID=A0A6S6TVJ9_9BACT|nr:MAG: Alkaline phosphatase (EC [uncultured Sulfurovum sp.]
MLYFIRYLLFTILFTSLSSAFIVGDWDFEDNPGHYVSNQVNTVIDKSGNNISGSPFNRPKLSTDTPTGTGYSVAFDGSDNSGSDSHIFLPHDDKMSMDSGKISFWFKPEDLGYQGLFSKDHVNTKTSGHLSFQIISSELGYGTGDYPSNMSGHYLAVRLQAANGSGSSYYTYVVVPEYVLQNDTWYYVQFIFGDVDFGMKATLYNQSMQQLATSSFPFYGGMSKVYGFNEDTNDVEVIEDVNETTAIGAKSWNDDRGDSDDENNFEGKMDALLWETYENPVLIHRFDACEQDAGTHPLNYANNNTGIASNSTITGAGSQMYENGKISRSLDLPNNNDYVQLDANLINNSNVYDFSILLWVKTTDDGTLVETNNDDIKLEIANNKILATIKGTNYTFDNPYTIKDDNWHQIILTRKVRKKADFSSNQFPDQAKINAYVDGHQLDNFYTIDIQNSRVIDKINISWMRLGQNFNGTIDEFALLKNKLSEFSAESILLYQERGLNWDGTPRTTDECPVPIDANLSINDVQKLEGNSGTTSFTFTVTLDTVSTQDISVDYATSNGTATLADNDYIAKSGTVNFAAGETSKTVTILVNGDTKVEPNETFNVTLSNPTNALIADGTGIGTILNDDSYPDITINDIQKDEGDSGTTDFDFTVSLSRSYPVDVTVDYLTTDGTATIADSDYQALTTTTLTIPAGQTTATITAQVNGDTIVEPDETFNIILSNPSNASISKDTGVGTILNDDSYPGITINDIQRNEGNSGTTNFTFTVSLDNAYASAVSVDYATSNGTATLADNDYIAKSGTVNFAAGETSKTVTILVNGDTKVEPNETFNVTLSNPSNASISKAIGVGTILNDDTLPTLSINDTQKDEGDSGTTDFDFTVSLSRSYPVDVTVDYLTTDDTATIADSDYQALTTTTLTIPAGQTTATITAKVNGDTIVESDETFNIILSNPSNASISKDTGVGTILNDDSYPGITINDIQRNEGNDGTTNFTFTVSLENAYASAVSVDYDTSNGTATLADNDYNANSGTVNFAAGETSKTVTILVNGDTKVESDETFNVTLSNPSNASISKAIGVGTILNDDTLPTLSINDIEKNEGDSDTTDFDFTVSLSRSYPVDVTVDYLTTDDTATIADSDYQALTTTTLTIPAGQTTATITAKVNGDTIVESDETFNIILSNPSNASISDNTGVGTILNDDSYPGITINDIQLNEGDSDTTNFTFTISLENAYANAVSVDYATSDGTATLADNDYNANSGTVNFAAGETSKTVTILVNGDTKVESDETFNVTLSNPTNALIADGTGIGTILNDDSYPDITINDIQKDEGDSDTTDFDFTVSLSRSYPVDVTVDYLTTDGNATIADSDYQALTTTTLTIPAGQTTATITAKVNGDTIVESDETFNIILSNPSNASISKDTGVGTILNDDSYPGITINDIQRNEGNDGTTNFTFTVSLENAYASAVSVDYDTSNGTATLADNDYIAKSGTVNFAAGETSKTVTILVNGDTKVEPNETFRVTLSNPTNATISKAIGVGTILNDDFTTIGINDVQKEEGDYGTTDFEFTLTLDRPSYTSVSVDYRTSNGTAETADSDYNAASGRLTIGAGETTAKIIVMVNGDTNIERDETFTLTLSSPSNTTLGKSVGTGTIINDDFASLSVGDVSVYEGDDDITNLTFTLNLSEAFYNDVTLNYATQDGTATVADNDYIEVNATQVVFAPNETSKEINISVVGDLNIEDDETLFLLLSNPTNATISDGNATGTILNDDIAILSINDVNLSEGDAGYTDFNFTVSMTLPHREDVTVNYATSDGTALIGDNDYNQTQGTLTFEAGEIEKTVTVKVIGDFFIEDDETFTVILTNVISRNAYISDDEHTGTGTILNDDSGIDTDKVTFNVERTNTRDTTVNAERFPWYTQISGREFDYDVVSYDKDMTKENPLSNVVVRVSLRSIDDLDTQVDEEQYLYFSNEKTRTTFNDLKINSAHKDAIFRIFVPTDGNNTVLTIDCSSFATDYRGCYDELKAIAKKRGTGFNDFPIDAQDNFAIRPAGLHYGVSIDNENDIIDNIPPESIDKALAAGEGYYMDIKGKLYDDIESEIPTYTNSNIELGVVFNNTSGTCNDENDYNQTLPVSSGSAYTVSFKNNQVGIYTLSALDEEWTKVDQEAGDCDIGKSTVSAETDGTTKSGCNIGSEVTFNDNNTYENDIITFHPHHFDVNVSAGTKPENLEFVYMHSIEDTDSTMSAQIDANVTALSKSDTKLSNFTHECMAKDVQYSVNISTDPSSLLDTFSLEHYIYVNVENTGDKIENNVSSEFTLSKDKFAQDENGTAPITLNYNIDRSSAAAMNPVAVTFNALNVSSEDAKYNTSVSDITEPTGSSTQPDTKTFLYARLRASQKLYEGNRDLNPNNPIVTTPLAMDIYCEDTSAPTNNLCVEMNGTIVQPLYGIRTSLTGDYWWLATASATSNEEGNVTLDNVNENNIAVPDNITDRTDVLDRDNAINLNVTVDCPDPNKITEIRLIDPSSPWIIFDNDPLYSVRCSGSGDWAGEGDERSVVDGATTQGARLDADGNRDNDRAPANQSTKTHRLSW